jgi:hypothetical protein
MADWIRRSFTAVGLTQIPPGPCLRALQSRFGGTVMLCIDVSGSLHGAPVLEAVRGARQFVAEAVAAHYSVGVTLWDTDVVALAEPSAADGSATSQLLGTVTGAYGGNNLFPPLNRCHQSSTGTPVTGWWPSSVTMTSRPRVRSWPRWAR